MANQWPGVDESNEPRRGLTADLAAPRRVFKRKRRKGLILALKIVLPLIAVSCVAYIVIWSRQVPRVIPSDVVANVDQQKTSDVTVKKVQYNGVDANNRPFSITAASAMQPQKPVPTGAESQAAAPPTGAAAERGDVVNLKQLIADMTMNDGAWVAVSADDGVYHRDAGTVDLSGNVTLFHDTGLMFETDAATIDLKNDTASGNQPIEGQNPDGQLAAQGFEVRDDGRTIIFTGRAYLKLLPKKGSGS
jgi:lipopolysaccharide export system protein LptC